MGENYNNSLDNSEVPHKGDENNTLPGFESERQARQFKLYLENLKLLAEFQSDEYKKKEIVIKIGKGSDGNDKQRTVLIKDLIPRESEFERVRKVVITQLNVMKDHELMQWQSRFATDDVFDLSGRIASYQLDKKRRDDAYNNFDAWKTGKVSNVTDSEVTSLTGEPGEN